MTSTISILYINKIAFVHFVRYGKHFCFFVTRAVQILVICVTFPEFTWLQNARSRYIFTFLFESCTFCRPVHHTVSILQCCSTSPSCRAIKCSLQFTPSSSFWQLFFYILDGIPNEFLPIVLYNHSLTVFRLGWWGGGSIRFGRAIAVREGDSRRGRGGGLFTLRSAPCSLRWIVYTPRGCDVVLSAVAAGGAMSFVLYIYARLGGGAVSSTLPRETAM